MSANDTLLLPAIDEDSAPFWEGALVGELRVQECADCGRLRFPPRPMCPYCQALAHRWPAMSGRGRLWSLVFCHPPLLEPYASQAPYNVAVVSLDEDSSIRLVGNVVPHPGAGIGELAPDAVSIDDPVAVVFERVSDDIALPRWIPDPNTRRSR